MDPKLVHQPKLKPSIFVADNTHHLASWATLSWINHGSGSMDHASSNEHGRCQHIVELHTCTINSCRLPAAAQVSARPFQAAPISRMSRQHLQDSRERGPRSSLGFGPPRGDRGSGTLDAGAPRRRARRGRPRRPAPPPPRCETGPVSVCLCVSQPAASSALRLADTPTPPRRPRKGRRPSAHSRVESFQRPESHDR